MSENKRSKHCVVQHHLVSLMLVAGLLLVAPKPAKADFVFGTPENLGSVINSAWYEGAGLGFSDDGLSLAFVRIAPGTSRVEGWLATRTLADGPWETAAKQGNAEFETGLKDPNIAACFTEFMSPDGLEVHFVDFRLDGMGGYDIWMMNRQNTQSEWGPVVNIGPPVNTEHDDWGITLSPDGLELYFCDDDASPRSGGLGSVDIWVSRRASVGAPWGEPVNLGQNVNSDAWDSAPYLSQDGLLLFFDSRRSGGYGSFDLYMSRRASLSDPWQKAVNLGPTISNSAYDESPQLSADGSTLYWGSERTGGYGDCDIWQASVLPIVDFNGDGQVDGAEVLAMTASWGQDDSLCDIGPTPFGDGLVDLQDVVALAEYIGQDIADPTLVAHWTLDEIEGMVAADGTGAGDGQAIGTPNWQPDGGQIDGALELDGDDAIVTGLRLDPSTGAFSVLAWVQGGAPGQVVVSQQTGQNWLMLDAADGTLRTELASGNRNAGALSSTAVITDGDWHRVAFVWDGTNRRLYVDSVLVAEDVQDGLNGSSTALLLGCGHTMTPATFWTGLIDDVRVYNRVVRP